MVEEAGFKIQNAKMCKMTDKEASYLFEDKVKTSPFANDLINHFTSDICLGLSLLKNNAVADLCKIAGPENSMIAKNQAPDSIRAIYGRDNLRNAVHVSASVETAEFECDLYFNEGRFKGRKGF